MSADETTNAPGSTTELKVGMELRGKVKNIELFGAFVDIGTGQDALLHISQLGQPNVRNVEDVVKTDEEITVYVLKIHEDTGRVALSLEEPPALSWEGVSEGNTLKGTVVRIENYGVFVDVGAERPGMVHVSELADGFVKSPSDVVSIGDEVEVRVLKVNRRKRQIDLSMKPQVEEVEVYEEEEDEEEGEVLTAMAIALRKAMEASDDEADAPAKLGKRSRKSQREEQEDILARTLREHSSS
jgi:ribosomal protein S1